MQILAATDFSTRSNRALRQAGLLAQPGNAQLHIVHVVDDDHPEELIRVEKREAERLLDEQAASMPELSGVQPRLMVVTGDPFDGILKAASGVNADLIVMGSHRKQLLLDIFIGTTIERVIRNGSFPVLMVNHEAQRKYENVVAAIDMSDASANALRVALSTGLISDKGATLLHAFWRWRRASCLSLARTKPASTIMSRASASGPWMNWQRFWSRTISNAHDGLYASRRADRWRLFRVRFQRCVLTSW